MANEKRRTKLLNTTGLTGYFFECIWLEWLTGMLAKIPRRAIFHFIYPENSYYFTHRYRRSKRAKIIATYHQPVEESKQFILKTDAIQKLDAIILLSETQREFFEPLLDRERIFVVPHGIDLSYFQPSPIETRERRIIVVGSWLRDFYTLSEALRIAGDIKPDVSFDIVSHESNRRFFTSHHNVTYHHGITDDR